MVSIVVSIPRISVLINTRNRPNALIQCIRSVVNQKYREISILILDDGSTESPSVQAIVSAQIQDDRINCFRSDVPLGVAGGRNFLMRQSSSDLFCFLDDDATFHDLDSVNRILQLFDRTPKAGILSFKVTHHHNDGHTFDSGPFSRYWLKRNPDLIHRESAASYYIGTCHAMRKSVVERCGYYSEDFFFGEEELDLSYRAVQQGFQILYSPSVCVHHYPGRSAVDRDLHGGKTELYYHVRNRLILAYQYLPVVYVPVYWAIWTLRLGLDSLRLGFLHQFIKGFISGMRNLKKCKRTPLDSKAIAYLKQHYGRIWY